MQETKQTHYTIDVKNIIPLNRAGGNIRVDYGDLDDLINSIKENGIIVPIRAYRDRDNEGQWIAIDGHRRLSAAMQLIEQGINIRANIIVVDSRKISDEQIIYDMITTNSGKSLTPIEMSEAVRRLIAYGHTTKEIAKGFGKNIIFVKNLELLSSCPKRIRDLVSKNKISYSLVLDILKETKDFNEAINLIETSLTIAKEGAISKIKSSKDFDFEANEIDEANIDKIKITKSTLNKAQNKVDSVIELKRFFKRQLDNNKPINIINSSIYAFSKKIVENNLTLADIEKILLQQ